MFCFRRLLFTADRLQTLLFFLDTRNSLSELVADPRKRVADSASQLVTGSGLDKDVDAAGVCRRSELEVGGHSHAVALYFPPRRSSWLVSCLVVVVLLLFFFVCLLSFIFFFHF